MSKPGKSFLRIEATDGMVNIDGPGIAYGNIRNMYKTGAGNSLQLSECLDHKRGEIVGICADIADGIYKLHDILGG